MSRFLSSKYEDLEPYTPGEQPKNMKKLIKLNTNENPYDPAPEVLLAINNEEIEKLRLYSDPEAAPLIEAAAGFYGVDRDMVMAGNGSDEVLAFLFMAFQQKSGRFYFPEISYSFYPVYCSVFGAEAVKVPLKEDFSIDPSDYYGVDGTIIITNPNAPTGIALALADIEEILQHNPEQLVVIDEAYVDFGAESAVSLLDKYDNLLVVQTLSKSRSLAGARVGLAISNKEIIEDLNRIKFSFNPYNLNRLSILAGTEALKDVEYFNDTRTWIIKTRETFVAQMEALGFTVLPSKANFVFATHPDMAGQTYFEKLRERQIIVRHFKDPKICEYVRITIGTPEAMDALMEATKEILEEERQDA